MSFRMNGIPYMPLAANQKNVPIIMGWGIPSASRHEPVKKSVSEGTFAYHNGTQIRLNSRYHVRRPREVVASLNGANVPHSLKVKPNSRYHVRRDRDIAPVINQTHSHRTTTASAAPSSVSRESNSREREASVRKSVRHSSIAPSSSSEYGSVDLAKVVMDFCVFIGNKVDHLNMARILYLFTNKLGSAPPAELYTTIIYISLMIIEKYKLEPSQWVRTLESYDLTYVKISDENRKMVDQFLEERNGDGYNSSEYFACPNGDAVIDIDTPSDISTLSQQWKWTPCMRGGQRQCFLAPHWGSVKPVVDTEGFTADVISMYPSRAQRKKEVLKVLSRSQKLSSSDKAAVQLTDSEISIPGICMILAALTAQGKKWSTETQLELFRKLAVGLFQSSIDCWKVKKEVMACRPIQQIRGMAGLLDIDDYTENKIKGASWTPYRLATTSWSSPEYVSETATYTGFFAKVMSDYTGTSILDNIKIPRKYVELLSPVLKKNISQRFNNLTLSMNGTYHGDVGIVSISHSTWDKLCKWLSNSDLYAGVATPSSIQGGLILGQKIADVIMQD